jgi:hypothetical protein
MVAEKGGWYLIAKKTDGHGGYKAGKLILNRKRKLSKLEVDRFKQLFDALGFWDMPIDGAPEAEFYIRDGSRWVFEAVQDGKYRIISRHSPKSQHWATGEEEYWAKFKQKHGLPNIDAETHFKTNEKLIALCEYLVKLAKLKAGKDIETY